jgi:sulfoxide reductase catalytic subunit YedY
MSVLNLSVAGLVDEITPENVFFARRRFIKGATAALTLPLFTGCDAKPAESAMSADAPLTDTLTPEKDVVSINNFYEFGTSKSDPARYAGALKLDNWRLAVEGEVKHARVFGMDDLMKLAPQEERVYRWRCVETWSMVVPWLGFSLSHLINAVEPTRHAKFVEFVTLADPTQMPGLSRPVLDWPYTEGLRLDEAMHPLALLTFGVYGKPLPPQNGAPVRLVVPWKYGFKSGKSLVKIRFVREMPRTSWMRYNEREYGFYANVNPNAPHPRWSQAYESRVGDGKRRPTLLFNGYDEVASLYQWMDLVVNH